MARPELNITVSSNSPTSNNSSSFSNSATARQGRVEAPTPERQNAAPAGPAENQDEEAFPPYMVFGSRTRQVDHEEEERERMEQEQRAQQQRHADDQRKRIEQQERRRQQVLEEQERQQRLQRQQQRQRDREQRQQEEQDRRRPQEHLQQQRLHLEQTRDQDQHSESEAPPSPPTRASSYRRAAAAVSSRLARDSSRWSTHSGRSWAPKINPFASGVFDVISEHQHPITVIASEETPLRNGWRPLWLRRTLLAIFAVIFVILVVAAELVLKLVDGQTETHYVGVWTFGPVVVASILLVFWSRVESQCSYYTPWIVISRPITSTADIDHKDASQTLLLDYPSMWFFQRFVKSLANRHFLVAASTTISVLLRVQIVLSTGMFRLDLVSTDHTVLVVEPGNIHTAAAWYGLSALLVIPMLFLAPSRDGITPRDPTTLGGTAALLRNSRQVLDRLRGSGAEDILSIQDRLLGSWTGSHSYRPSRTPDLKYSLKELESKHSYVEKTLPNGDVYGADYHPWTMRAIAFVVTIAFSAVMLAALWAIHATKGSHGQFTANTDNVFLWTSLVTFIFLLLSSYTGALDADTLRLTPYFKMTTRDETSFKESVGLAYTDDLGFFAAMKALHHGDWGVFVAKCTTFLAFLVPIFSAGLFAMYAHDDTGNAALQPQTFFDISTNAKLQGKSARLTREILLDSPPQYPPNTWAEFALPSLAFDVDPAAWELSYMNFTPTVPATRAALDCQPQIFSGGSGLTISCGSLTSTDIQSCKRGQPYVGFVAESCSNLTATGPLNYIWGSCDKNGTINVLTCNETFNKIDIQVPYVDGNLRIDPNGSVVPDDTSEKTLNSSLALDGVYNLLQGAPAGDKKTSILDDFFRTLVQSHLQVPIQRLGAAERSNSVIQGILMQHAIVRAQALNNGAVRQPISGITPVADTEAIQTTFSYTMLELIQANPQTYALTALLSLIIILSLISLLIRPRMASLPKSPSSIAAQASLLADSTIWFHLPRGAEFMTDAQLAHRLRKKTFRVGMINHSGPNRQQRNFTLGIVQDEKKAERKPRKFETPTRMLSPVSLRRPARPARTIDEEERIGDAIFADGGSQPMELEGDQSYMYDPRDSDENEWEEELEEILKYEKGPRHTSSQYA